MSAALLRRARVIGSATLKTVSELWGQRRKKLPNPILAECEALEERMLFSMFEVQSGNWVTYYGYTYTNGVCPQPNSSIEHMWSDSENRATGERVESSNPVTWGSGMPV